MATVFLPELLSQVVSFQRYETDSETVSAALRRVFADYPALADYVVDSRGALKENMTLYVDGREVGDRVQLSDALGSQSGIHIVPRLRRDVFGAASCEALAGWKYRVP
jgi:sulfur-carrier protein